MKVKSIIVGLAILGLGGLAAPVRAQTGQNCWVDNRTNAVVCEHQDRRDDCSYPENRDITILTLRLKSILLQFIAMF